MADLLVWGAYVAIPFVLVYYARHRKDLPFKHLFWLFGSFIAACGATHFMGYLVTYYPAYRLDGLIKVATALASWGTVFALVRIGPRAMAMRMPEDLEHEITERKAVEVKLHEINEDLLEKTRLLEQANSEMEGFTYLVSHDLRTPLRSIVANSRYVLEESQEILAPDSRRNLERLGISALKLAALVDDLLEFSRLGRHEVRGAIIDATTLLEGIADELKAEYPVEIAVQRRIVVRGDSQLLRLAFYNLLQNACKYADPSRSAKIDVNAQTADGMQTLSFKDNGIGFEMAYADKVFQPFERLHRDGVIPGTGIGLANVRRIIERHGGRIWAESEEGVGSTFYVQLPV